MAQVLKLKRTAVQGKVPNTSSLELGELAINTYDGKIYFEKDNGTPSIQTILVTDSTTTGSINLIGAVTASYFKGDGSALTNLPNADVSQVATVTASFDNQSNISVTHNFDTRNILVSVYDTAYAQIIPSSVILTNNNSVDIELSSAQSGFAVVAKGGHIVSGTLVQEVTEVTTVTASFDNQSTISVTHSFGSKNILVSVYDTNDSQIIPSSVVLTNSNTATIGLSSAQSGYVVVAKGGHLVNATGTISYNNLTDIPSGIISGSSGAPAGTISGSSQLTSSFDERYTLSGSIIPSYSGSYTGSFSGSHTGSAYLDYILFNPSSATTLQSYMLQANTTDKTLDLRMGSNATLQLGQELYNPPIVNKSGTDLNDGDLVMVNPAGISQGNRISVVKAVADGTYAADKIVGVLTEDVANNAEGFATWFGYVRNISKTHIQPAGETWAEGDILYANPTIAGKLTNVFPTAPNLRVTVATVTSINGNNVTIMVNFHRRTALKRAHDVLDNSTTSSYGDFLMKSGSVWINNSTFSSSVDNRLDIIESTYATTGSNLFRGTQTHSGSIIPAIDNTYDLGSPTYQWRDIYVSSGSLYIDGTKVLGSTNQELQITTDVGQSIKILEAGSDNIILQSADGDIQLKSSGGGNLLFDPTTGLIDVRGTLQIQDGNKITSSGGNTIEFGNNLGITGSINASGNINGINLTTFSSSVVSTLSNVNSLNAYTSSLNTAFQVTGSKINFQGDVVIYGTQSIINSQNVEISDNILYLSPTASIDNDLGVVGHYNDGTYRHAGIFMDASDGHSWKVFNGLTTETSAQIDTAGNGFQLADFKAGAITGTSFTGTINSTNGVVSGSSQIVSILSPLNTFSASVETKNSTLETYTGSLETKNSTLATYTGSVNSQLTNLINATSSYETKGRGIVSGSSQIDVLSTTNISRLATTGSNIFIGNQTITGSINSSDNITVGYNAAHKIVNSTNGQVGGFSRRGLWEGNSNLDPAIWAEGGSGFYIYTNGSATPKAVVESGGTVRPGANGTQDLGSSSYRWSTIYTSDLSLNNGIGDWTIVEGEDDLFLYNNKKGKVYKFALTEVDPSVATPKKS